MKKYIALLCMLTCIFGLTACNEQAAEKTQSQETAEQLAATVIIPYMTDNFSDKDYTTEYLAEYNVHEVEALVSEELTKAAQAKGGLTGREISVDGNSMKAGITSFNDTLNVMEGIRELGEITSEISKDEISVSVEVKGMNGKDASAEFVFSNDIFFALESIALNQNQTMGELIMKGVYDTLMGMGTVFLILILICFIISAFGVIPKLQKKFAKKEEVKEEAAVDNTIAQIMEKEELSDDTELVAVIAAAIAASEGAVSTDGFVVRSIRKANRSRK